MNRREALAASVAILFGVATPRSRRGHVERLDPYFVWREQARFDREVAGPIQDRLARAMAEKIDRDLWSRP